MCDALPGAQASRTFVELTQKPDHSREHLGKLFIREDLAEREGFEPPVPSLVRLISSQVH